MEYKDAGNNFFKQQKWAEAIEQYSKGLASGDEELPADVRGLLLSNRSQCRLNLEEWQEAYDDADACVKLLPEHSKSLFRRAAALEKLGKVEDALTDYCRVVKADQQNKAAVQAAQRLREQVMRTREQRVDESLPIHLFDVLRQECTEATVEKQVDAAKTLRAYCVHKGMAGSLLSSGAVELFVEKASDEKTLPELRHAVLGGLVSMASGTEAQDDEDDSYRAPPSADKPLAVPPPAAETRKRLRRILRLPEVRLLCHSHAASMRQLMAIVGYVYEVEDTDAFDAAHSGMLYAEGGEINVPRAGIMALASICDRRRRDGGKAAPLVTSSTLLKCLETALGVTSCQDQLKCLLAAVFTLLADEDRNKKQEVDLPGLGLKILEPFLVSSDFWLKSNGLAGLTALFACSTKAASSVLQSSQVPFMAILVAIQKPPHGPEGREGQNNAVECLFLAAGDQKTRQSLVDAGGVDIMLHNLSDGQEGSGGVMRAKLVAVLAIIAGHNKDVREEVFDRIDFLVELRHALDTARESAAQARESKKGAPSVEESRRLLRALYESVACLTIHGEYKEELMANKKTLKAIQDLAGVQDLVEDPQMAFFYSSIVYNLCRSREDKIRPKKDQFPFNQLTEDDLNAVEEFYEKMPAEAKPVKNGEIDSGSKELAEKLRSWCVLQSGDMTKKLPDGTATSGSNIVSHLGKCAAHSNVRVKTVVAMIMKLLVNEHVHRRYIVSAGGVRTLLGLVDLEDEAARDAARQSLAQILIVTNPVVLPYSEQLDAVRPLVDMMDNVKELLQFEGCMAFTNLLTASDELRSRAVQGNAWSACRDLLFSETELVQRAGLEAMCNLSMAPEILEKFADGKYALEIRVFISFCVSEDQATAMAASGALAMLASCDEVAVQIAKNEHFGGLFDAFAATTDAAVQHRITAALCELAMAEGMEEAMVTRIKFELAKKKAQGFVSKEAEQAAKQVLEASSVKAGGA